MDIIKLLTQASVNRAVCLNNQNYDQKLSIFKGLESKAISLKDPQIVLNSNYSRIINKPATELTGFARGAGQASYETQRNVMGKIMQASAHLDSYDQAILLAIAKVESGFNPDAAASSTSAAGVFQLVKQTGLNLGISQSDIFDADKNIKAGVFLYEQNAALVTKKFPQLSGTERAVKIYALHHDGPSLQYGGEKIARERVLPEVAKFYAAVKQFNQFEYGAVRSCLLE